MGTIRSCGDGLHHSCSQTERDTPHFVPFLSSPQIEAGSLQKGRLMKKPSYLTHQEYALTKVALAREDVPADALALLSAWIEGERLLVDDREEVGGINFCRMDSRVMAPLPHIVASFFARRPYKRKAGHYPRWNGF